VNAKRVHRLCRQEGLKVRRIRRKQRAIGHSANAGHVRRAEQQNQVWCWDFSFDRTTSVSTLKWLSIMDDYTRECLTLKVDRSITSDDVIDMLAEPFAMSGVPQHLRSDNGPEFVSQANQASLKKVQVATLDIAPGSPRQNGYAESVRSKLVDGLLRREVFVNMSDARQQIAAWRTDYNEERPDSSLGYVTPAEFAARCAASVRATPSLQQHDEVTQRELS